ncbi:MAG: cytochrome d ubiquinol oxidase subunit II [Bacteroidales bacterium]|nr:cytochrome d ubiquinol oxidase subunit II [Bacteroidales bacterium]
MISYLFLQHYWWIIVSLLASLLVFLMFVQGGQSLIFSLPESDLHTTMIINALGRKWEFTFTTLVTFGGAFFASFPLFYATSFGGAYWLWIAILFSFIIQAVAYEFRSKPKNVFGRRTFDTFLFINGSLGPFLIGTAVATFFTGSQFILNEMNQVKWLTSWYGLEALMNVRNLALGFAVLLLSRINSLLYIINTINDQTLNDRSRKRLIVNSVFFLVFFLFFLISLVFSTGFAADPSTGAITLVKHKYLLNFIQMPVVLAMCLAGVVGVLYGIGITVLRKSTKGIWFTGTGTVLAVFSLLLVAGFNGTSFYPSASDLESSLTIHNASSSRFTLTVMMYISFIIPFVFAYIWYAWKSINNSKINVDEMKSEEHKY